MYKRQMLSITLSSVLAVEMKPAVRLYLLMPMVLVVEHCKAVLVVMQQQVLALTTLLAVVEAVLDTMAAAVEQVVMTLMTPLVLPLVEVVGQVMFILQYLMDSLEDLPMVKIIQIEEMLVKQDKMQR